MHNNLFLYYTDIKLDYRLPKSNLIVNYLLRNNILKQNKYISIIGHKKRIQEIDITVMLKGNVHSLCEINVCPLVIKLLGMLCLCLQKVISKGQVNIWEENMWFCSNKNLDGFYASFQRRFVVNWSLLYFHKSNAVRKRI